MTNRKKIVVTQNMTLQPDQVRRLESLGDVTIYKTLAKSSDGWLERCKNADIICSGKFGLKQRVYELPNTFISLPFVGIGWLDKNRLKKNNITIAISPGCNKDAVSEWIIGIMISLFRKLPRYINITDLPKNTLPEKTLGLTNKNVCILGAGNIGSRVGKICEAFDMNVKYFRRGGDLIESVKDADVIINCLSQNPTTDGLLDKGFFNSLKRGSYFISVTSEKIYDINAIFEALDKDILAGAGIDAGDIQIGDTDDPFYKKLIKHPKILATPHIAYNTDTAARKGNDMMIDNIEAWLKGNPINLVE